MATKSRINRTTQQNRDQKLIDGLTKYSSTVPSLIIGGVSYTTAAIIAVLQSRITDANAALTTRATWQSAVQADRDERTKTKTFVSGLRQALQVAFAGAIDQLADFGLTPRKPRAHQTPEQKAKAVAKAQATRAARHTMGSKQKAAIKGTVPGTAPATAPAAPAPTVPVQPPVTAPAATTGPVAPATPTPPASPATPAAPAAPAKS
jgi:hypothetical protein